MCTVLPSQAKDHQLAEFLERLSGDFDSDFQEYQEYPSMRVEFKKARFVAKAVGQGLYV